MNGKRLYTVSYRFPGVPPHVTPGQLVYASDPGDAIKEVTQRVSRRAGVPTNVISIRQVERFSQEAWRIHPPVQVGLL